jgi:tRNA 2-thiocytidine biosynthesis protein TtcA
MAIISKVEHKLLKKVRQASKDWGMVEPGDKIMVAVSGGKDSYAMLRLLQLVQARVPFDLELVAVNLDQGHPGFPAHVLEQHFTDVGVPHRMLAQDTYKVVLEKVPEGKTYCSLCSRLRRGILYKAAAEMGCTKLALGHHRDDIIETLMLNLFYSGQIKAMAPCFRSDDDRNTVIRPLAYCSEEDIIAYAEEQKFPIIPCDLCGSQDHLKRKQVKALIAELHADNPKVRGNIFAALGNVQPSHLLDADLREAMGLAGVQPG